MFLKLFNWLVKRVPYCLAVLWPPCIWSGVYCGFLGFFLILARTNFDNVEARNIFTFSWFFLILLAILGASLENGLLRFLGVKFERKQSKILNENTLNGRIRLNISTRALLQTYSALNKFHMRIIKSHLFYISFVVISSFLILGSVTGYWDTAFVVLKTAIIVGIVTLIGGISLWELLMSSLRKECTMLLRQRGKYFKEFSFMSLKTKSKFFGILIAVALGATLVLMRPIDPVLIILLFIILFVLSFLSKLFFQSIYEALTEIRESAKDLASGRDVLFSSGSSDKEIINLSKSLNISADKIKNYQKALEEKKASLEIKVKARTRELEELTQSLDQKVKERTIELREKINDLEKFYKLTVGRELRMVELKKEIKKYKEETK